MNSDFSRILSLLRKERGLSQKQAAESLGISQALLSHYEKGIREPGLDFLCRAASYYSVSCDYLLGRSSDKTGMQLTADDLPDSDLRAKAQNRAGILPLLNKKLLINSLQILFDLLIQTGCKGLINEISGFLMLSVYRAFRVIYHANPRNLPTLFALPRKLADGYAEAASNRALTRAAALADGDDLEGEPGVSPEAAPSISSDSLSESYSLYASSLLNLVKNAESKLD